MGLKQKHGSYAFFSVARNLDQLHHVIKELVVITQTPYITYTDTKAILDAEPAISGNAPQTTLNLSTTLDEINHQIIHTMAPCRRTWK